MGARGKRIVAVFVVLSLVLAVWGQYYLAEKREFMWDGIVLYLASMIAFVWAGAQLEARKRVAEGGDDWSFGHELWLALGQSPVRLGVLILGVAMGLYAATAAVGRKSTADFWDLLIVWALSVVVVVSSLVDWSGLPDRFRQLWARVKRPTPEDALVLVLVLATFLLRVVKLGAIPYVLSGDEASMGLEAVSVLEGQRRNPFRTGWLSHPTLFFFVQAVFLKVGGITITALRLPSAIISGGIVWLLYVYAHKHHGRAVALIASVFFATYHYAIHFGRLAINNIWDPFYALGVFYFVIRGLERKKLGDMLVAGVLLGLAIYFYMGARLIPIILLVYLAYRALTEPGFVHEHLAHLAICALIAVIVTLPILAYWRAHPRDLMSRWSMMGIFPSGWVEAEMQRTGNTVLQVVWGQFLKAALAFNYYPDPTFWYRPGIPLLCFVSSIFFVFGLTRSITRIRQKEHFLLVIWFLGVIIFGGTLLENPPTSPRLVLAIPPVVIWVAMGIRSVASYLQQVLTERKQLAIILAAVFTVVICAQSTHFYYRTYTPSHVFGGHNTEVADRMGKYLRVLGPNYQCYFHGAPRMYYGFATIPYIAQGVHGIDVPQPPQEGLPFVNIGKDAVFVFLPERRGELDVVRRTYPDGLLREFRNERGQMLFIAYEVDI